ncbi:STAS domain-containing protein [Ferrimonas lipolytica]|uniref:STAS domain-containing protein n=1 Tax=Ferrimonas lipolytica TaxID=2724191 RepID=A0A6H1UJA5_9GAMM|nr:STAS domain-containing protein [Ferrimonas lipolytica]QIZ77882.1 STAS domain-containing protein [Ferrimonas lipolytica]
MSLQVSLQGSSLKLVGQLTVAEVEQHWPVPEHWFGGKAQQLDLALVDNVDSAGLAWLLELESRQQAAQGEFEWLHCSPKLTQLMTLYDLSLKQQRLVAKTTS